MAICTGHCQFLPSRSHGTTLVRPLCHARCDGQAGHASESGAFLSYAATTNGAAMEPAPTGTLLLSRFQAMVVPSGWRTRVQPIRWIIRDGDTRAQRDGDTRAQQDAVLQAGLTAAALVPQVVGLARRGGLVAAAQLVFAH
jgi:hypothetical protein